MTKTLTERFREVTAIPDQLDQVSRDVTKLLVSISLIAVIALVLSIVAVGVASRAH